MLIEASFAMQYGIRLAKEDISFGEFCRSLSGLTADTPLGRVVAVRAEKNVERIKAFGEHERSIRKKWRDFVGLRTMSTMTGDWSGDVGKLQSVLDKAFGR